MAHDKLAQTESLIANHIPEEYIVAVDSGGGHAAFEPLQTAVPHTWLNIIGGSIGTELDCCYHSLFRPSNG